METSQDAQVAELLELFQDLSDTDKEEVLTFIQFLYFKNKQEQESDEVRQELIQRKESALAELQNNTLHTAEDVHAELEAQFGM